MIAEQLHRKPHSTAASRLLKLSCILALPLFPPAALGQAGAPPGDPTLQAELARLLRQGSPEQAVRHAQAALQQNPKHPGVRQEYIWLHLALARDWLAARDCDAALTAVEAVLALDPENPVARALTGEINAARARAGQYAPQLETLLRLELFEAALDRLNELRALRPDLAERLTPREQAAWLGAADDHYLARNFNEAFALYEHVLAKSPDAPADVHSRWALSLALAISESDFSQPMDPNAAGRLLARAVDVLRHTSEPVVGLVIGGLLAERAGQLIDAGRSYAEALGAPWELPPADRRRETAAKLRRQAVQRLRELYNTTPTRRREGMWTIALPGVWKHRRTSHFDVHAGNDLVAARVAEALEYHYPRLADWLNLPPQDLWEPRLEVRVHATQESLHKSTAAEGITYAVSHTRLQGERVILRKLEVFQADPWLLSATLPHELTHVILADAYRQAGPPLAIDEGLALRAEPPARRLMYRRLLSGPAPDPGALLRAGQLPVDVEGFYARADALTGWLLDCRGRRPVPTTQPAGIPTLLATLRRELTPNWWIRFGWSTAGDMQADWRAWFAARGDPPRMPLMILVEPSP